MFFVVTLILVGLVAGGMAGGAVADAAARHPGDIGRLFIGMVLGATLGAALGGALASALKRKFPADPNKVNRIAAAIWIAVGLATLAVIMFA